jgi:hypothetical protein
MCICARFTTAGDAADDDVPTGACGSAAQWTVTPIRIIPLIKTITWNGSGQGLFMGTHYIKTRRPLHLPPAGKKSNFFLTAIAHLRYQ